MVALVFRIVFLLLHISYVVNSLSSDDTSLVAKPTLVKVFVAFRHGSRAPSYQTYANDTYKMNDTNFWPAGPGELTKNGKQEVFEIGEKLRNRYAAFLGDFYKTKDFRLFSTLKERTMMSAQLAAAAIFPPKDYQNWSNDLNWQPVPVFPEYVVNGTDDTHCKWFYVAAAAEMKNTPPSEFGFDNDDLSVLQNHIGSYNKDPFTFMSKLWDVWDTLFFQDKEKLILPDWTKNLYPDKMTKAVLKFVMFWLSGTETRKMALMGPYAKALESYFTKSERKMELHAWHDLNLMAVMTTLGVEIEKYPDTTAALAIELHKNNGEDYFEVYYYSNHKENIPRHLKMPCGANCSYSVMIERFKTYAQSNYEEICARHNITLTANNIF